VIETIINKSHLKNIGLCLSTLMYNDGYCTF